MRNSGTNQEGPTQVSDPRMAQKKRSVVTPTRPDIPAAALVMLLAFVVMLGALVIPNVIAIVRG
jgi:hypothetical protein